MFFWDEKHENTRDITVRIDSNLIRPPKMACKKTDIWFWSYSIYQNCTKCNKVKLFKNCFQQLQLCHLTIIFSNMQLLKCAQHVQILASAKFLMDWPRVPYVKPTPRASCLCRNSGTRFPCSGLYFFLIIKHAPQPKHQICNYFSLKSKWR